jgi:hypothetical protein
MKKCLWSILLAVALACTSCDNANKIFPVSGKVIYKGSPAAGATVFFQRCGGDRVNQQTVMGIVQEDGSFTLVCGHLGKGAPPGEYDVLIEWRERPNRAKGLAHKTPDRLKGRFADPKRPRFQAVVHAEANNLPPFELTD